MKKIFLLIFILASTSIFAQNFKLNELIKMRNMNWDDFDTYVTSKGYQYNDFKKEKNSTSKHYKYNGSVVGECYINRCIFFDEVETSPFSISVSFQTIHKEDYLAIKNQLKIQQFKYIGNDTYNEVEDAKNAHAIGMNYVKNKIEITLTSYISPQTGGTTYEIWIGDYNKN